MPVHTGVNELNGLTETIYKCCAYETGVTIYNRPKLPVTMATLLNS